MKPCVVRGEPSREGLAKHLHHLGEKTSHLFIVNFTGSDCYRDGPPSPQELVSPMSTSEGKK